MAITLTVKHTAGLTTLYGEGWVGDQRISGANLVDPNTIIDANWGATGIISLTEKPNGSVHGVGMYVGSSLYIGDGLQKWYLHEAAPTYDARHALLLTVFVLNGVVYESAVDALLDTIKSKTDLLPGSPAAVGSAMTLAASERVYHAQIELTRDTPHTADEYTGRWYRDLVRLTAADVTSPTIQVVRRANGADLLPETALTQIGSTGAWKYDATGAQRLTSGEAGIVVMRATVDGATRTFEKIVGRDA